ncbi:MAG: N-acetyltransferase [Alphaproteobacteria bacterium]|nr:N-acetyltransferase [Alphaproteobacteria bacterium]
MIIRETMDGDADVIARIHETAFGQRDEAILTANLLDDPSAAPVLSLIAELDGAPVGHVLFTKMTLPDGDIAVSCLAPLAVVPNFQKQGIGKALIRRGLDDLARRGTDLVFVLGDPTYYGRSGFEPALPHGLEAPHPLPPQYADAWMVQALRDGVLGSVTGRLACADALAKKEYWSA